MVSLVPFPYLDISWNLLSVLGNDNKNYSRLLKEVGMLLSGDSTDAMEQSSDTKIVIVIGTVFNRSVTKVLRRFGLQISEV